jgi:hypothetical protein
MPLYLTFFSPSANTFIGSTISRTDNLDSANIHVIVHGQTELFEVVKSKLILKGFKEERIFIAKLDEAGNIGEYVAMAWPPRRPHEIIVSQIVDEKQPQESTSAPGAWESVQQKELYRIPLM